MAHELAWVDVKQCSASIIDVNKDGKMVMWHGILSILAMATFDVWPSVGQGLGAWLRLTDIWARPKAALSPG
jgi:hypothetical protein